MKRAQMLSVSISSGGKAAEPPCLVGVHHAVAVAVQKALVEVHHAGEETRREHPDAAVIEQVDALRLAPLREHRIVAEMRIAVDDADLRHRVPPRLEHRHREPVADLDRAVLKVEDLVALQPAERQQALRRQVGPHARHPHLRDVRQHGRVEGRVLRLVLVIELFADAGTDLGGDLARVDRGIHPAMQREHEIELLQVRFHGGLHVGILQLAGEWRAVERGSRDAPGRAMPRRQASGRMPRSACANRCRVRSPCAGSRRPRPSAEPRSAAWRVRSRIPAARGPAPSRAVAPPS